MFDVVTVRFTRTAQEYSFLTDIADLKEGDLVIVDSAGSYKLGVISSTFGEDSKATKWVICHLDRDKLDTRLEMLMGKQEALIKIKKRIDRVGFLEQAKLLAQSDAGMAKLLGSLSDGDDTKGITTEVSDVWGD